VLPDHSGAIDWIEFPSFRLVRRVKVANTERHVPFTREGMAIRGKQLLLLPEDEPSRLFIFTRDRRTINKADPVSADPAATHRTAPG
jgi:hypothetical protein